MSYFHFLDQMKAIGMLRPVSAVGSEVLIPYRNKLRIF